MMKIMLAFVGSIYYTVDFNFCLNIVDFGSDWCLLTFFWSTIAGFMWMKQILHKCGCPKFVAFKQN